MYIRQIALFILCLFAALLFNDDLAQALQFGVRYDITPSADQLPEDTRIVLENILNDSINEIPEGGDFFVTSVRWEEDWAIVSVSLADLDIPPDEGSNTRLADAPSYVVLLAESDGQWSGSVEGDPNMEKTMAKLPADVLSSFARNVLMGKQNNSPQAVQASYKLPWPSGFPWIRTDGYGDPGWHNSALWTFPANHSLDFDILGYTNSDILAAATGTIRYMCRGANNQWFVRVEDDDGVSLGYLHLDGATVPSNITELERVTQGQYMGRMREGWISDGCGTSEGTHIHIFFPYKPFTIDGYTFTETYTYQDVSLYSSQGNGGCCGCLPASCCGSAAMTTGADTPTFVLYDDYGNTQEPETTPLAMSMGQDDINFTLPTTPLPPPELAPVATATPIPDIDPPVFNTLVENQRNWSNQPQSLAFSWQSASDESELAGYRLYWGDDPNGTGEEFTTGTIYNPTELPEPNQPATRYLRVAAEDAAGNQSAWQTVAIWHYDPIAPSGSLTVASGSPTVRSLNVSLDLDADDEGSFVTQMRFSRDGNNWSAWEPYAISKAWQLANTDMQQTIFAQVQDEAGNTSETLAASITAVLNVELPSSPSYSIARSTFGMGGGDKSSPSYQVRGTSGQAYGTGRMQSTSYRVNSGYWAGSVCPTVEFVAGPTITTDGSTVTLSWTAASGATSYNIYRDTTPFFAPTTSYRSTTSTTWDDPEANAIGDPATNYYYIVKPVNGCGESSTLYRLGAFDFGLTPGS